MPTLPRALAPRFESEFVEHFVFCLTSRHSPWELSGHMREFDYSAGRTDIVATTDDGALVAFEAKLTRWRDALRQAYRNRAFAHTSYVLMPLSAAKKSAEYAGEYNKYGVGLCTLCDGRILVLISACHDEPLLEWLADKARNQLAAKN